MTQTISGLVAEVESFGASLEVESGQLKLTKSKLLPASLLDNVRLNKVEIVEAFLLDRHARAAGFSPLILFEAYERRISQNAHVFIIKNDESSFWNAWRETFGQIHYVIAEDGDVSMSVRKSNYVKVITENAATFEFALFEAGKYLKYLKVE